MRLVEILLDSSELRLIERFGDDIPPYAILSHTWGEDADEVTYQDMVNKIEKSKSGHAKIEFCRDRAQDDGLSYFWIDTCCIDKTNSVELTEAINSMFDWYLRAARCYVYLSDVYLEKDLERYPPELSEIRSRQFNLENECVRYRVKVQLEHCKWFSRGWTLQELIAPASIEFWSQDLVFIGTKGMLLNTISKITGVDERALCGYPLSGFSEEERLSWANRRRTKRPEDRAYSLLGIFNVRMRPDYGEGRTGAMSRLHRKISKSREAQGRDDWKVGPEDRPYMRQARARSHFLGYTVRGAFAAEVDRWLVKDASYFEVGHSALQPLTARVELTETDWSEYRTARKKVVSFHASEGRKIVYCQKLDLRSPQHDQALGRSEATSAPRREWWKPKSIYHLVRDRATMQSRHAQFDFVLELEPHVSSGASADVDLIDRNEWIHRSLRVNAPNVPEAHRLPKFDINAQSAPGAQDWSELDFRATGLDTTSFTSGFERYESHVPDQSPFAGARTDAGGAVHPAYRSGGKNRLFSSHADRIPGSNPKILMSSIDFETLNERPDLDISNYNLSNTADATVDKSFEHSLDKLASAGFTREEALQALYLFDYNSDAVCIPQATQMWKRGNADYTNRLWNS